MSIVSESTSYSFARQTVERMLGAFLSLRLRIRDRIDRRKRMAATPAKGQLHFGSLDDRVLNDLGLQRGKVRAAEYGLIPGDLALHHQGKDAPDGAVAKMEP